mmetsp:Transcript_2968/g.13999  ORF Transcript_2968/g.13999 Transcript_2968/m.13999 type:complete len:577 (-) Transcript_2968:5016-6746(-)
MDQSAYRQATGTFGQRGSSGQPVGKFDRESLRGMQRVLRWPIICCVAFYFGCLLTFYFLVRALVMVAAISFDLSRDLTSRTRRELKMRLENAKTYDEWTAVAKELDRYMGAHEWKSAPESSLYDHFTVESLMDRLVIGIGKARRGEAGYARDMTDTLLRVYNSNLKGLGIDSEAVYSETYYGTKDLIEEFIEVIVEATKVIHDAPERELSDESKLEFFLHAERSYGRMAVCLSSGAMMANYHFGTVKGLASRHLLPEVISGTSGGAFVAALVCTRRDEELQEALNPNLWRLVDMMDGPLWKGLLRAIFRGHMVRTSHAAKALRGVFSDITFKEAYERTGRILCITATSSKKFGDAILLNYITAPNVTVWSAILASSAVPPVLEPMQLYAKNPKTKEVEPFRDFGICWTDGAFRKDVPRKQLSETFNVNYLVVSQMNPHIVPFLFDYRGSSGSPPKRLRGSGYRGGFILSSLEALIRLEMIKMLTFIDQFDLLPALFSADFSRVFLQDYSGDVTIYPRRGLSLLNDVLTILTPPDYKRMEKYITLGESYSWPKLRRVRNHLILEQTLKQCIYQLSKG